MGSAARAPATDDASDDFERDLSRCEIIGGPAVTIAPSGDPRHGSVMVLAPNGDVAALVRGSSAWGTIRVEGEMMFPSAVDNYLGFLYSFTRTAGRMDFGLIHVKGNVSDMSSAVAICCNCPI